MSSTPGAGILLGSREAPGRVEVPTLHPASGCNRRSVRPFPWWKRSALCLFPAAAALQIRRSDIRELNTFTIARSSLRGFARQVRANARAASRPTKSRPEDSQFPCRRCPAPSREPAHTVQPCRRCSPTAAGRDFPASIEASSLRMSPNMLFVTMTSNCAGLRDDLHGAVVDVHVLKRDIGKLLRRLRYTVSRHSTDDSPAHSPYPPNVTRRAAMPRKIERHLRNSADFIAAVDLGVEGLVLLHPPRRCRNRFRRAVHERSPGRRRERFPAATANCPPALRRR